MTAEARFQEWAWTQEPTRPPVVCESSSKRPVATLSSCSEDKVLARAALIAAAPAMYATLRAVLEVLQVMAQREGGQPAGLAAQDMIPAVEHTLAGADFMGEITPAKLLGD